MSEIAAHGTGLGLQTTAQEVPAQTRLAPLPVEPYGSSLEHLREELLWARLCLERSQAARGLRAALQLSNLEDSAGPEDLLGRQESLARREAELSQEAATLRQRIEARLEASASHAQAAAIPLLGLARRFGLSRDELRVVMMLLAPEIDPWVARAFSQARSDLVRPHLTVGLLLELLAGDLESREALRVLLEPQAPLRRLRLVLLERDAPISPLESRLLDRYVKLAQRIVDHLRARDHIDEELSPFCRWLHPTGRLEEMVVDDAVRAQVLELRGQAEEHPERPLRLHLHGPEGSGRKFLTQGLLKALAGDDRPARRILLVDWGGLATEAEVYLKRLHLLAREAMLESALLYLEAGEQLPEQAKGSSHASRMVRVFEELPCDLVLGTRQPLHALDRCMVGLRTIQIPFPDPEQRSRLWKLALGDYPLSEKLHPSELGHKYVLSGGSIQRAASRAKEKAAARGPGSRITPEDLDRDSRAQANRGLSELAERIETSLRYDDAVLSPETDRLLQALLAFARQRRFVLDQWGFRRLLPYGQGLGVLFTGPPGTGKTMVASIVARDLGMECFRVDLSRVVNKYIGETEKNLARIFDTASDSNTLLLFDEADSLFATRTDVRSSVDRYANLEVNYLLQRMEQHDGVTILTTNFEGSLDRAFRRRLKFHILFPVPDAQERALLWRKMLPPEADVAGEICFELLGDEFEFSGGYIKNAILRAAIAAADAGEPITEARLLQSAQEEAEEMGLLVHHSSFRHEED